MRIFDTLPSFSTTTIGRGPIDSLPDARLQQLAGYWCGKRQDGAVPARAAIDPLEIPALLPNIMLLDRVGLPDDERYRFRLCGTDIAGFVGRELTGLFIDEALPAGYHGFVRQLNRTALAEGLPVYSSSLYHDEGNFVNGVTYRLVLPLRGGEGPADMVLACQYWQRREETGHWLGDWRRAVPEIRVIEAT